MGMAGWSTLQEDKAPLHRKRKALFHQGHARPPKSGLRDLQQAIRPHFDQALRAAFTQLEDAAFEECDAAVLRVLGRRIQNAVQVHCFAVRSKLLRLRYT